jgi:5-methyltetrahydrofolate--homocysteine methyltransferase
MERRGLDLPLLIGGATTSKQHTAVRIAPAYGEPTLHVLDASRVVRVVSSLLEPERRATLVEEARADQERLRELHGEKQRKPLLPLAAARANRTPIEWRAEDLEAPRRPGEGRGRPRAVRARERAPRRARRRRAARGARGLRLLAGSRRRR